MCHETNLTIVQLVKAPESYHIRDRYYPMEQDLPE